MIRVVLLLLATLACAWSEIVPTDRRMNWTTYTGVQGGIPNRTSITNAYLRGCDKTGVTNCESLINTLFAEMPQGYVLYFPAGTYKVGSLSTITRFSITIRGDGMGQTTWKMTGATMQVGNSDWLPGAVNTPTITVTNGATNGSTVLYVSSTNLIAVNYFVVLTQTNPPHVHYHTNFYGTGPGDDGHGVDRLQALTFRVVAVNANSVTLNVPLPCDFTNVPMLTCYSQYVVANLGFEDMTFNMSNTTANAAVLFQQSWNCWLKNVEVVGATRSQFRFFQSVNCEIRGCLTRDTVSSGPNHEGIDLYQNCCWFKIEDNACIGAGFPQIILGDWGGGCSGNVIGYNFVSNTISGSSVAGYAIADNHGPHNMFNLIEGNVAQNFSSDGYYGSSSHGTLIRNHFTGKYDRTLYDDENAITLCHWAHYYTLAGNILGTTNYSTVYEASGSSYQDGLVYRHGYPNTGNRVSGGVGGTDNPSDANQFDTAVTNTMLRTHNWAWNYGSNVIDSAISGVVSNSYYLTAKPAWFSNAVWPAMGPDLSPMVSMIPAQMRYLGMDYGAASVAVAPSSSISGNAVIRGNAVLR